MRTIKRLQLTAATACAVSVLSPVWAASAPDMTVVEYFHSASGHYFMTGSADDQRLLESAPANASFAPTGRSFAAWSASNTSRPTEAIAVARFFSPASASHVFTSKSSDISLLRSLPATNSGGGFVDEGTAFFALAPVNGRCDLGQKAIFRAFNNRPDGNHRYSNELELHATMVTSGFADDAVAFCSTGVSSDAAVEKRAGTPRPAGDNLTLSGTVSAFVSISKFNVGTQAVDASNARFDHGSPLALVNGLAVTVEGVVINGVLRATEVKLPASTPLAGDDIKGFVTALGATGTVFVNGTPVDLRGATISGGTLAQLIVGREVEVHGAFLSGTFVATLVHLEDAPPVNANPAAPVAVVEAEIKGLISGFVSLSNFTVGTQKVNASAAVIDDGTAADLVNGATVQVHGTVVSGIIKATRVEIKRAAVTPPTPTTPPSADASFEATGTVSGFVSTSSFVVSGVTINASAATFKNGSAADLKNGAVVEVKGTLSGGVVRATSVEIKSTPVVVTPPTPPVTPPAPPAPPSAGVEFEATGAVTGFVSIASFKLSGTTIDASTATFEKGSAADLKNGVQVQVKGTLSAGVVKATRVRFEK